MSEKLIHLTFKNPKLAEDEKAKEWLDKMEKEMNSEENIKNYEEAIVDCAAYGVHFAVQNLESKILKKMRLDPKEIFKVQKPEEATAQELMSCQRFFEENFLQNPRPLQIGDRVKLRYGSKNIIWILKEIYADGTALVEGILERKEGVMKKNINLIEITEWTQN